MDCGNAGDVIYHSSFSSTNMLSFPGISTYMLRYTEGLAVTLNTSEENSHRKNSDGRGIADRQIKRLGLLGKCKDKDMDWQRQ